MSTAQRHGVSAFTRRHARHMRVVATDAERAMWLLLRDRRPQGFKFRRQVPFQGFILDFVSYERKLAVEVGGGQHANSPYGQIRAARLLAEGFRVVRYWNNDVRKNPEGILRDLGTRRNDPSPGPPLRGEPPSPTRGED